MEISSLLSTTLDLPPSCIAFCPSHPEYFVVGTYFLHLADLTATVVDEQQQTLDDADDRSQAPQQRSGGLVLYHYANSISRPIQTIPLSTAVLDIAWSPFAPEELPVLCIATASCTLELFDLRVDRSTPVLVPTGIHIITTAQTLVLDVVFHPTNPRIIGATLSNGEVVLCRSHSPSSESGNERKSPWNHNCSSHVRTIARHSLEPWTLTFSDDGSRLFTGGDDGVVQCVEIADCLEQDTLWSDYDEDDGESTLLPPLWSDRKTHGAGVTALLPIVVEDGHELLITGSYDDHIRLLSTTGRGRREVLAELDLGGGVWRLEMVDQSHTRDDSGSDETKSKRPALAYTILASCMHAGTRIVTLSQMASADRSLHWQFEVRAQFTEHKSMNYGSAVQPVLVQQPYRDRESDSPAPSKRTIVSTSFYDKLLCIWEIDF